MKLKYILGAFLSALLFVGCSDDDEVGQLGSIQLDQTYVSIPETGGDVTVTINASSDWKFDDIYTVEVTKDDVKEKHSFPVPTTYDKKSDTFVQWLKPSVVSGPKGETKVTFHADATTGGREAELRITMGDNHQFLVVRQGSLEASMATCAEVVAAPDGKTFRVKGTCTAIANTTYGNWYLNDGTGEVYIYGTLDKDGKTKNFSSLGIEVGDVIEVEGPKTTYNGTVELVDVTVISITKSLIKLISEPVTVKKEGDEVEVKVAYKGNGAYVNIPAEAQSWVSMTESKAIAGTKTLFEQNPADTAVFKFRVAPNEGEARQADIEISSGKSSVAYTITQLGGVADVTVADFLAASVGEAQYRLTGVITELYTNDRQGKSFYIQDYSGKTLVYRAEGFIESGAKAGDVVTVVGQRGAYNNNPQMVSGQFERLDHVVTEVTIEEFLAKEPNADVYYRISGTIENIANAVYGNVTLKDETGSVYVYGCYPGWGATGDFRKGLFEKLGIEVGDRLSVIGVRAVHNDSPQLSNGVYFSHEKGQ